MHSDIPAVVVGGSLNALGVIRSLSQGQMPIFVVETTRQASACWSRYCSFVAAPSLKGTLLVNTLVELGIRLGSRPVLILTSDESVDAISSARNEIAPLYRISLPSAEIVRALADKTEFQLLAARERFCVPRGVEVSNINDCAQIAKLSLPIVLKPADKTLVLADIAERAVRADTLAEAEQIACRMLRQAPRLIVQEWIDGPETEIFFSLFSCDRDGRLLGLFHGRKLVCSPPMIGTTAVCMAAPEVATELTSQTQTFIERVGYRGIGSLEFKRDSRSGRFLIVEPTVGRTDWQEEIATLCGINLPLLTYRAEIGLPNPAPSSLVLQSAAWRASLGFRPPRGFLPEKTKLVDGFVRRVDPLPAVYHYAYDRGVRRVWRRIKRAVSRPPELSNPQEI
jgi:predicted ATP-grasp superfamily ATP-dependent carboligase